MASTARRFAASTYTDMTARGCYTSSNLGSKICDGQKLNCSYKIAKNGTDS